VITYRYLSVHLVVVVGGGCGVDEEEDKISAAVMATQDDNTSSDDADDNAEMPQTKQTGKRNKALPWTVAKAHIKVTAGKKKQAKSSKRGAGGAKTKKKGASKTAGPGGEQELTSNVDGHQPPTSPADSELDSNTLPAQHPASPLTSTDANKVSQQVSGTGDGQQEAAKKLRRRQTVDAMYVT